MEPGDGNLEYVVLLIQSVVMSLHLESAVGVL